MAFLRSANRVLGALAIAAAPIAPAVAQEAAAGKTYDLKPLTALSRTVEPPSRLGKAGQIVVCTELGDPPAAFLADDGVTPKGFNIDIVSAIGTVMGLKTEVVSYPFASIFAALDTGKCDIMMSTNSKTPARVAKYDFVEYMLLPSGLLVAKGNPLKLKTDDDLSGHTIAVLTSSTNESILKAASDKLVAAGKKPINIQSYPQNSTVFHQLELGRVDAMVSDAMTMGYFVKLSGGKFEIGGLRSAGNTIGMVLRKDDPQMQDAIRKVYVTLFDNGYVTNAAKTWGMEGAVTLCRDDKQCP